MALEEFAHFFGESKISTKDRNKLDDSQFGIPSLRKYPLTDEEHVLQALRFFNKAPAEHKKELALNIQKRGKELKMEWWKWFYSGATLADYKEDLSEKDQHIVNGYYTRDKQHEKMPAKKEKLKKKMNDKKKDKKYFGESDEPMKNLSAPEEANKCLIALRDVKYDESSPRNWILRSPDEVIIDKLGNCHDTTLYTYSKLDEFAGHSVEKSVLFFIEYNDKSMEGKKTHSVCYENIEGGICVIECSWGDMKGTFPYNDVNEYINTVRNNWEFSSGCNALYVTEMKNYNEVKPGINLKQYVDIAMKNDELMSESYVPNDNTTGTSDFDDGDDDDPDDCFTESGVSNGLVNANLIATRIHEKYEADKLPPCGNQNCMLCTMCAEAQFRGKTDMPRPVHSPRDPVLEIKGESIVNNPRRYSLKSGFDDMLDILTEHPYARWYCHASWSTGRGGHEFLIINDNGKNYIMDPQQGIVDKFLETHPYIKDIKWEDSYIARLDDSEYNESVLKEYNTMDSYVPWDAKLDIPYMLEHDMISKEEAEQYWKDHPDEAPKDRHFLTFEELDKYGETKNKKTVELTKPASIFTSGDFAKYGKDVDLTDARGPITEAFVMEFDHKSEKLPVKAPNTDKVYFGSPRKYERGIKTDRPLFVTPFMGIASIFIYGDLDIQNKVPHGSYNLEYEEWVSSSDEEMSKPFKEVHVYVEGYPELEPYEIENTGYIHTVNVSKYKNDFYRYEWMSKKIEYLIDVDESLVDVESVQEVTVHYYVSGKASKNPKLGPYKNEQTVQESWNDMKRGVNSRSKTLWFHISQSDKHEGKVFTPRVPEYLTKTKFGKDDPYYEDMEIPRVCFSPSIEGALHAITSPGDRIVTGGREYYVYIPEKPINQYKRITNKELIDRKLVFDAKYTKECWITEPVKLILYGTIMVDQVSDVKLKTSVTGDAKLSVASFKWHWQVKPKAIKIQGHESYEWNDEEDNKKTKKKKDKPVKEEYDMSDFVRDPSVLKMILEAEAEEDKDEKEEEGDAIDKDEDTKEVETTEINTEVEIGVDDGGEQNQYNPEEVNRLNQLINSEMSAVSEYFNAAKESKEPNLMRLFSDIGDEERFHLEQLLYAKSMVTGEEYEPQDPKVKKEYKELLDLGLDEETAMTTAIDKVGLMPKEEEMSDEDEEDIKEGFTMISMLSSQTQVMLEAMTDTSDINEEIYNNSIGFLEQMYISEEVYNLNTKEGQKALGTKSPIRMIWNAFKAVYNLIISIVRKAKLAFQKMRIKNREKWAWIKRHGIKGLFANGISLYFYNDKTGKYELGDGITYLKIVHIMNEKVIKAANITTVSPEKYDIDTYIKKLIASCQGSKAEIKIEPVSIPSIAKGMNDLNRTTLTKSKCIITDENQAMFEELFFGYTEQGFQVMMKEGENSHNIKLSFNVYNQLNYLLSAFESVSNETQAIIEALANMEGKQGTVYATNNNTYKECVSAMNVIQRALNQFTKAVSDDIKTCMDVNRGLMTAMQKSDEEGNSNAVDEYKKNAQNAKDESDAARANATSPTGSEPRYTNG